MKCRVKDCENHSDQGVFIGFLCMPCFTFLNTGEGIYSQLYRNTVAAVEREWVDLTVTEIKILRRAATSDRRFAELIQAKLKEKNDG